MQHLDVVIPYRDSGTDELKYALRSLKNIPHRNVFICGDKPDWVSDEVICLTKHGYGVNAQHDAELNLRLALTDVRLSNQFIFMNDDFYILKPITSLPDYQTGTIRELIRRRQSAQFITYCQALEKTLSFVGPDALSFELHVPAIMDKINRMHVSDEISPWLRLGDTLLPRSIYFNRYSERTERREDVKLYGFQPTLTLDDFLSTENDTNMDVIRELFPEKSPYEQ